MSGAPASRSRRFALKASVLLYRLLIRLRYPAVLRRRFGDDMEALFRLMLADDLERGALPGLARAWWRVIRDLARPLPAAAGATDADPGGGMHPLSAIRDDVAYTFRSMWRDVRFAAVVVLVPAAGIALAAMVFAVVNAYLLRPLPYPGSERLVSVRGTAASGLSWDEVDGVFERAVSWDLDVFSLVGGGEPELVSGAWITPTFLEVYDVRPALGRGFLPDEGRRGSAPVALISDRLWRERFGADRGIVGRSFSAYMSDRPDAPESFTIVGVLPPDFWYFNAYTDVLTPIVEPRAVYTGRLREGLPRERAAEMLTALAHRRRPDLPDDAVIELVSLHEEHVSDVRPILLVVQGAVLLVLLIACANTAVLLLVRAAARERELGVRRALGAQISRLARQLLTEGVVLAALAGSVGLALAALGVDALGHIAEQRLGRSVPGGPDAMRPDATVVAATVAVTALIGIAFGLVPLAGSARRALSSLLGEMGRGGTDTRKRQRARHLMVGAEVALSLALLTGAGLMVRSAANLQRVDPGFRPDGISLGEVGLRQASYPHTADRVAFFDRLIDGVRALPGVEAAALASAVPFTARFASFAVETEADRGGRTRQSETATYVVGDGWFETMQIELVRGRDFTSADVAGAEPVAIISEALAQRLWPGEDPIGRRLRTLPRANAQPGAQPGPLRRVVGVVADVRRDLVGSPGGDLYTPLRQSDRAWMHVVARARPGSSSPLPAIEEVLHRLDPVVPLSATLELEHAVENAMGPTRFLAALLAGFSAFALALAVIGLYGVIAYAARQRRRDIAIRMALGADRASVAGLFLRQGMIVVGSGIAFGTIGGYALGRALAGQLHGVAPGDPLTHVLPALLLLITAAAAIWLPAHRAATSQPMRVLRE